MIRAIVVALGVLLLAGQPVATAAPRPGYLTSAADLSYIREQWQRGVEPYKALVNEFIAESKPAMTWESGAAGTTLSTVNGLCVSNLTGQRDRFVNQQGGAQEAFRKAMLYHLTGDPAYAKMVRDRLMELTITGYYGGDVWNGANECVLHLSRAIPLWIQAADLVEGSLTWTEADRAQFSAWLINTAYPKTAWASRVRRNNWGSAGSLASSTIADYVGASAILNEVKPVARQLTGAQAFAEHNAQQLARLNTVWQGDSKCTIWGIRATGGIPDETRRGSTGCTGTYLVTTDDSYMYQIAQIDELVYHAEYLRRRGDTSLFDNAAVDGSGSILASILFVIANPTRSWAWESYKIGVLSVADAYYHHPALHSAVFTDSLERGAMVSFGQLTHPKLEAAVPTPTETPTDTPTPTATPTDTPTPTPTDTPTPTPTPTDTPTPTATPTPPPIVLEWDEYEQLMSILATAVARRGNH